MVLEGAAYTGSPFCATAQGAEPGARRRSTGPGTVDDGDNRAIALKARGDEKTATSRDAESLGLIVTELVINAIKHAFKDTAKDAQISVAFDVSGTHWKLSVTDNGVGTPDGVFAQPKIGLGNGIVNALAKQRNAKVETLTTPAERPYRSLTPLSRRRKPSCVKGVPLKIWQKRPSWAVLAAHVDHFLQGTAQTHLNKPTKPLPT